MIYTLGYSGRAPERLKEIVEQLGAILIDIRFSPRSRDPRWAGSNVKALVGADRYLHLKALGNVNYRTAGAPVQLADPEAAVEQIGKLLSERPVILLCACRDWKHCHRRDAAEWLANRLGAEVRHLA